MKIIKPLLLASLFALPAYAFAAGLMHRDAVQEPLTVDQAFNLMPAERNGKQLSISWEIAPGYYLYRERMAFEALEPQNAKLQKPKLPPGELHHDEHFGDVHTYRGGKITAAFKTGKSADAPTRIKVSYQGCAEIGICYPPQTRIVDIPHTAP